MSCGAESEANTLLSSLVAGEDFSLPDIDLNDPLFQLPTVVTEDLYKKVPKISVADLTDGETTGPGVFDALMRSMREHLNIEFEKGRITGAAFATAYGELTQGAMSQSIQFLLGKEQAYWAAMNAQLAAVTSQIQMRTAQVQLAAVMIEARNQEATYALTKMRLASESMDYCLKKKNLEELMPLQIAGQATQNAISKYNLDVALPEQNALAIAQREGQALQNETAEFNLNSMLPEQLAMVTAQKAGVEQNTLASKFNVEHVLPEQLLMTTAQREGAEAQTATTQYTLSTILPQQKLLLVEQTEVQRAQTVENRTDGALVAGAIGKQKLLTAQQITSYQRDMEMKLFKSMLDSWITQKTIDEGLAPPNVLTNSQIDAVAMHIRTRLELP